MGMSVDDFCRCTPSEFTAAWTAWSEGEESRRRDAWERTRMLALCTLQPHTSQRLRPQDVMAFPWENGRPEARTQTSSHGTEPREDVARRYREAKRRWGMS